MSTSAVALVWALWVFGGGRVNSGHLYTVEPAAFFPDKAECERVAAVLVKPEPRNEYDKDGKPLLYQRVESWRVQCIEARYVR